MKVLPAVIIAIFAVGILTVASLASAGYLGAEASASGDGASVADNDLAKMHQWKHMLMASGDSNESGPHEYYYDYNYSYEYNLTNLSNCDCDSCDNLYSYEYNYDYSYDKQE